MAVNETQTENRNKQHQQRLPFFAFLQNKMLRLSVARLRNGYFMFISSNYSSLILLAVK